MQVTQKGYSMRHRPLTEKNKYYIPKEDYLTAIHYSLRYPNWVALLETAADTRGAIRYDKDRVQTSNNYDSTSETAIRMSEISSKKEIVDSVIDVVAGADGLALWLRLGVCYGFTFSQLEQKGIPCGHRKYYEMRRRYYYELTQII